MAVANNKEGLPFAHYLAQYTALAPEDITRRCGFAYFADRREFELTFLGNVYAVKFPEFAPRLLARRVPADRLSPFGAAQILLIRHMIEGNKVPALGRFLPYRDMPWGDLYNDNFTGRCIKRLAFSFGNAPDLFDKTMLALRASPVKGGDRAYELTLLEGLVIRYIIWAGDDEFPPSAQILFSDNFSSAFTAEDMAVAGDVTIDAMKETAKTIQDREVT